MSIYCWTLGEQALARISKNVYAKVKIVKNEEGLFHDEKVLGIVLDDDDDDDDDINVIEELCYYVEICRSKQSLWLPYTSLRLAERSRPFYGPADKQPVLKLKPSNTVPKKRKLKEDHTLPMSAAKLAKSKTVDLNTSFDFRQLPLRQTKYENAYKEFIRRGKDMIFDEFLKLLQADCLRTDDLYYVMNIDASTEDKFEMVIKNSLTEKEVKNYLQKCWRYNYVFREESLNENSENYNATSPIKKDQITLHANWCLVCGKRDKLMQCIKCPASYHVDCRKQWVVTIMHRKSPPKHMPQQITKIDKILSSTRMLTTVTNIQKENAPPLCPSCTWGPQIGYGDVVWNKLGSCPWWPAKVLTPGSLPSCLVSRKHSVCQWPVQYYGTLNYSWCDASRMCLFLPSHTAALDENRAEDIQEAVLDACDDYIRVYLT